jgi:hypothetical protein
MSKTKALVGGKTLSLWIPDEEWVDDFNHLLAKRSKTDRSITRNSLFLHCVETGLHHLDEQQESDSIRIHLDSFPPEQADLLRSPAGKQIVTNLISAMLAGPFAPLQSPIQPVVEPPMVEDELHEPELEPEMIPDPEPEPEPELVAVAATPQEAMEPDAPPPPPPERKIPDLFHTLMRNTSLG